jgi:hypothetical protein
MWESTSCGPSLAYNIQHVGKYQLDPNLTYNIQHVGKYQLWS